MDNALEKFVKSEQEKIEFLRSSINKLNDILEDNPDLKTDEIIDKINQLNNSIIKLTNVLNEFLDKYSITN